MTTIRKKAYMPEITAWVASLRDAFGAEAAKSEFNAFQPHPNIFFIFNMLRCPTIQFTLAPSNPIQRLPMTE